MSSAPESRLVRDRDEIDALAYIDTLYQGKLKADVDTLIRREMESFQPEDYLESLPLLNYSVPKLHPLQTEHYSVRDSIRLLCFVLMHLQAPPPPLNLRKNVKAWREAIANAETQLAHQTARSINLDLMNEHQAKAWVAYNSQLKAEKKVLVIGVIAAVA